MMKRYVSIVVMVVALVGILTSVGYADQPIVVVLKSADSGNLLARCRGCVPGGAKPDNAAVHVSEKEWNTAKYAQWELRKLDNGKYALKSVDSGNYLARCRGCVPGGAKPDSAFVHVTEEKVNTAPYAQWELRKLDNGKYALKSVDSGNYLARCRGCVPGGAKPDNAFVHVTEEEVKTAPYAQWEIILKP
jgi:hypothetical protein